MQCNGIGYAWANQDDIIPGFEILSLIRDDWQSIKRALSKPLLAHTKYENR